MLPPVVLIVFNRPQLTQQVFASIRAAQPRQLFVVADGPRANRPEDMAKCQAARQITEAVDWDCEVQRNYADTNLGCRGRVTSGLDWVFSQVDRAIILEDDCVPDPSFFPFCQELLIRYADDTRIMTISGNNFQDGISRGEASYYFSKYPLIWGWATWARAWQKFDADLPHWGEPLAQKVIQSICFDPEEQEDRMMRFREVADGSLNAWAPRWLFTCWANHGLTVIPAVNLVTNIGFGADSTHTKETNNKYANYATQSIDKISHPALVFRNQEADQYMYDNFFGGAIKKKSKIWFYRLLGQVKGSIKKYIYLFLK